MTDLDFPAPLFVFEMANNHMGRLEHGIEIVRAVDAVRREFPFACGFKLQYRSLDTFIHPDFKDRMDLHFIKRFHETRLEEDQLRALKDEMARLGFLTVCTPFDEPSVDRIEEHGFDVIKIASCSLTDWPLLERIARSQLPVIASTAGTPIEDVDKVVSFFEHRQRKLALMHCVGEYPTPAGRFQLNRIDLLRRRYPNLRIGFSTHEDPDMTDGVKLAVAKGAEIFEKHVGVPSPLAPLNAYSASPAQLRNWLSAASSAFTLCGSPEGRGEFSAQETSSLRALRRGVYARQAIPAGRLVRLEDVFLAMPVQEGQLTANDLSKYTEFRAIEDVPAHAPVMDAATQRRETRQKTIEIVGRVKHLLLQSGVPVPPRVDLEISHHYGVERFDEVGLTMLTIVNREYCKKLIVLLPGQRHPAQYHKLKEETFHVLYGEIWAELDGKRRRCETGEVLTVERGVAHSFGSDKGAIIEEISSTHHGDDSYYEDEAIAANPKRKTIVTHWME